MTTLIEVGNSEGVVGRCDAKCYNAKEPDCTCVCGGANHGKGLKQATENTREYAETWLKTFALEHKLETWWASVPAQEPQQLAFCFMSQQPTNYYQD